MLSFYRVLVRSSQDGVEQLNDVIVIAEGETRAESLAEKEITERLGDPLAVAIWHNTVPIVPDVARVVAVEYDVEA